MSNSSPNSAQPRLVLRIEEVLESRYDQLRRWATTLTRGEAGKAEDMVHDLCVSMSLAKPDLSRVENLDNYLYKCLRHIYLSNLSSSSREALQSVTVADFDSIQIALWSHNESDLLEQQNDLRRICNYVVWRKAYFKGASYFVLRFFHGYHLDEIAELAGLPLTAVHAKLSQARSEVQGYMREPGQPRLVAGRNAMPEPALLWNVVSSPDLFRELRRMILDARTGDCLPEEELLAHYGSAGSPAISSSLLSHIVSCERCLSVIDRRFRRPTLEDREPLFHVHSEGGSSRDGSPKRESGRKTLWKSVQRLREEIYQHRPRRLSIAVSGKIIASHDVRSQQNVLLARIDRPEDARFIEVFSEQRLRIAFLPLNELPPEGPHEQSQHVTLSDGRWMTLVVTFDGLGMNSEVTYFDPALPSEAPGSLNEDDPAVVPIRSGIFVGQDEGQEKAPSLEWNDAGRGWPRPWLGSRLIHRLLKLWSRLTSGLRQMSFPEMNPTLATAMVLAVASILCFLLWLRQPPRMTANALLVHAEVWDSASHGAAPGVIYQKVQIKTRQRTLTRAIYRDARGIRTPRHQVLGAEDARLRDTLAAADVNWDEPLSATNFQDWHDHQRVRHDQITWAGKHLLKLTTTVPTGAIARASLIVRDTDFHPVARTIELRDSRTIEIAELHYELLPWTAAGDGWFEPAVSSLGAPERMHPSLGVHLPLRLTDGELDEAELSVRLALNRLHADNGERIDIVRSPAGIQVKGIVETDDRKHELESQLRPMSHVVPSIFSYRDMERQQAADSGITSLAASSVVSQSTPLESYLIQKGWSHDHVREISAELFDGSVAAYREGAAIAGLLGQFSSKGQLSPEASLALGELVSNHKARLLSALQEEERGIAEIGISTGIPDSGDESSITAAARHNVDLIKELVSSGHAEPRPAQLIIPELVDSITQLRAVVSHLPADLKYSSRLSVIRQAPSEQK